MLVCVNRACLWCKNSILYQLRGSDSDGWVAEDPHSAVEKQLLLRALCWSLGLLPGQGWSGQPGHVLSPRAGWFLAVGRGRCRPKLRCVVGTGARRQNVPWSYLLSSGLWMDGGSCPSACQPGVFRTCYIPFVK